MQKSPAAIQHLATDLGAELQARRWRLAVAESCTGGGVAAAVTSVPGSSSWFEYGLVTYADTAKQKLLQVDSLTLERDGAVSEAVVRQMVSGMLELSGAELAVATSGIAGPGGGSDEKPVGMVWIAWGLAAGRCIAQCHFLSGDRHDIQREAVALALEGSLRIIKGVEQEA